MNGYRQVCIVNSEGTVDVPVANLSDEQIYFGEEMRSASGLTHTARNLGSIVLIPDMLTHRKGTLSEGERREVLHDMLVKNRKGKEMTLELEKMVTKNKIVFGEDSELT